jgi:hypothetical protein
VTEWAVNVHLFSDAFVTKLQQFTDYICAVCVCLTGYNNSAITNEFSLNLTFVSYTEIYRHSSILLKIGHQKRPFYMEAYVNFCAHLERNSLNIYLREKCFRQTLQAELNQTFCSRFNASINLIISEIIKQHVFCVSS